MDILERIRQRASSRPQHIVLPEGNDPRTVIAAADCSRRRLARITVLGNEEKIRATAQDQRLDLAGVTIIDHLRAADSRSGIRADRLARRREAEQPPAAHPANCARWSSASGRRTFFTS